MTPFNSLANSPLTYSDPDGDLPILAGIALALGSSFAINAGINALSKAGVAVGGGGQGIGLYRQGGGGFGMSPPKSFGHDYFYNPDGSLAWVDYNDPDNHTHTNLSIAAGALTVSGSRPGFWEIAGQNRFRHWPQTGTGFGLSFNPLFPQYSAYTEGVSNITWDLMSPVMLGLAGGGFASNVGGLYRGSLSFGRFLRGGKTFSQYRKSYWLGRTKPILDPIIDPKTGNVWKQYTELHHRFIPQRANWAPNWLKNDRINLTPLSSLRHSQVDPYRARFAPKWIKETYQLKWK